MATINVPLRKVLVLRHGIWVQARMQTILAGEMFRLESDADDLTCPDGIFTAMDDGYLDEGGIGAIVGKPLPPPPKFPRLPSYFP